MTITNDQIIRLQCICKDKFISRDERLEALSELAGTELSSIKDLSRIQADELIYFFNTGKIMDHSVWAAFDKYNTKHRAILSRCHTLGWVQEDKPQFADLHRLGAWLKSDRSPVKRPLKDMDSRELSKIITAMDNIIKSKYQ